MTDWFYKLGDKVVGPVNQQEFDLLVDAGRIQPSTPVKIGHDASWHLYSAIQASDGTSRESAGAPPISVPELPESVSGDIRLHIPPVPDGTSDESVTSLRQRRPVDESGSDPAISQVVAGMILAILVVLAFWLMRDRFPASGRPQRTNSSQTVTPEPGAMSGANGEDSSESESSDSGITDDLTGDPAR